MNLGLSKDLKEVFTDVKPIDRPVVKLPSTIDPNWLAGFIEGEGNFSTPLSSPPIYLSLVVEGFVCINKWGERRGGFMVSGSPTTCPSLSPSVARAR